MTESIFIKKYEGKNVYWFDIINEKGSRLRITNFGATITSIKTADANGMLTESVLGFDNIDTYIAGHPCMGSTVGRYANRIKDGAFTLNGIKYQIPATEGKNALHGGILGFHKRVWDAKIKGESVEMRYVSADGEEGFPGTLTVKVIFELSPQNEVIISYFAQSDKDTIVNLTNHSYFNLGGGKEDMLSHELFIDADSFTPTDEELIPTGKIESVIGTPLDFTAPKPIGRDIRDYSFRPVEICKGYDNNYVLSGTGFRRIATLFDAKTGRLMETFTDRPAVQLYTAQHLEKMEGHDGREYGPCFGVCLETQVFPDAVNHEGFSDCVLKKGKKLQTKTVYKFSVE